MKLLNLLKVLDSDTMLEIADGVAENVSFIGRVSAVRKLEDVLCREIIKVTPDETYQEKSLFIELGE